MSEIRNNPPHSVDNSEELAMYQSLFDDITKNGTILEYHDRHLLGELAVSLIEMNTLRLDIRENGEKMVVSGDRGHEITKKNPSREALEKLRPVVVRIMKEFRMSPNSRPKITTVPTDHADDGWGDV